MSQYNILVTGVGAIIGYGIVASLRKSQIPLRIVAMDIYPDAYGSHLADVFYPAVLAADPSYVDFVNGLVEKESIDLIIPGIEQDLYALSENKEMIKAPVVMNNALCLSLSKDKWETYDYLKTHSDLELIPTLKEADFESCAAQLGLPFLLKPRSSYASKGIQTIKSKREFDFYTEGRMQQLIFQKITGTQDTEYTVSVFGDGKGHFFDTITFRRNLSGEGATSKATLVEDDAINAYVKTLVRLLQPVGPTNIQLRLEDGKPYLLEINPRISSACSLRTAFGYNEPEMCVQYYLLKLNPQAAPKKKGSAVRFIADYISYGQ